MLQASLSFRTAVHTRLGPLQSFPGAMLAGPGSDLKARGFASTPSHPAALSSTQKEVKTCLSRPLHLKLQKNSSPAEEEPGEISSTAPKSAWHFQSWDRRSRVLDLSDFHPTVALPTAAIVVSLHDKPLCLLA